MPSSIDIEVDGAVTTVVTTTPAPDVTLSPVQTDVVVTRPEIDVEGVDTTIEVDADPAADVVEIDGEQGPQGPPGLDGVTFVAVSSESISAVRVVRTLSDGRVALYSPTAAAGIAPSGISQQAGNLGEELEVVVSGVLTMVGAGFTPGARYWVKASGVLTATFAEVAGLENIVEVGVALDTDHLAVRIDQGLET